MSVLCGVGDFWFVEMLIVGETPARTRAGQQSLRAESHPCTAWEGGAYTPGCHYSKPKRRTRKRGTLQLAQQQPQLNSNQLKQQKVGEQQERV